jgi:hypothetical protein
VAAGVPYVALPPATPARRTPLVVAWQGLQAPRGEQALSTTLPLRRLPAWRAYLRLPGSAAPASLAGPEPELPSRLGTEAFVQEVFGHVAELPAVVAALRARLPGADGPVGLLGWSAGAMVVLLALAERTLPVPAVALVRPVVQLQRLAAADPGWRGALTERFDFFARAAEIAEQDPQPAVLVATGVPEDPLIGEPAERLWRALADRYRLPSRVALLLTPGAGAAERRLDAGRPALATRPRPHRSTLLLPVPRPAPRRAH